MMTNVSAGHQVADVLGAWVSAPLVREAFVVTAQLHAWQVLPQNTRPDLLVVDAGWGLDDGFGITAGVVRNEIVGITARLPYVTSAYPVSGRNPAAPVGDAAWALWGPPTSRELRIVRWETDAGTLEVDVRERLIAVVTWHAIRLLAMPVADRPRFTPPARNGPWRDRAAASVATVELLLSASSSDPMWPQAVDRASELAPHVGAGRWSDVAALALSILALAHERATSPCQISAAHVRSYWRREGVPGWDSKDGDGSGTGPPRG